MNDFDKIFVLAFYNYFLKIALNFDKENMYMQFSQYNVVEVSMCSDFKDNSVLNILRNF